MIKSEIEKSKPFISEELIEYVPNAVVIKTILNKFTGNISVIAFDSGEDGIEKINPFDVFVQIIDGQAEIVINKLSNTLLTGQSIVIPANASNFVKPGRRFKMIQTVIKSGYE